MAASQDTSGDTTPQQAEGDLREGINALLLEDERRENEEALHGNSQPHQNPTMSSTPQQEVGEVTEGINALLLEDDRRENEEALHGNSQPYQNPTNYLDVQDGVRQMARAQETETELISVNAASCVHELINMNYNAITELGFTLDSDGSIDRLILKLLSLKEYEQIWKECYGGDNPAMGLLIHLSQTKLTTLREFKHLALEADPEGCTQLVGMINDYPDEMDKRLDLIPSDLLLGIASEISAHPQPLARQRRPLWKSIAGKAGLDMTSIRMLDMPATHCQQSGSMTETFIQIATQKNPYRKVAWLAKGLKEIEKFNALRNRNVFSSCIRSGCIKIPNQ